MTPIGPRFYSFTRLELVLGHEPMELTWSLMTVVLGLNGQALNLETTNSLDGYSVILKLSTSLSSRKE